MGILSNISGKDAVKVFQKFGYSIDHQTGSHSGGWMKKRYLTELFIISIFMYLNYLVIVYFIPPPKYFITK